MGLSDLRRHSDEQRAAILQRKMERAKATAQDVINSDVFKAQIANIPDVDNVIEQVATEVCRSVTDPVQDFNDVMVARGFNDAVIRKIVRNLALAFNLCPEGALHEERIKAVAVWAHDNPWVYESLDTYR